MSIGLRRCADVLDSEFRPNDERPPTIETYVEAILTNQRLSGEAVDPAGSRKFVRMLIAVGLLREG